MDTQNQSHRLKNKNVPQAYSYIGLLYHERKATTVPLQQYIRLHRRHAANDHFSACHNPTKFYEVVTRVIHACNSPGFANCLSDSS